MIKISHEVPICLLEHSLKFNMYNYCLPHLLDQNEEYRNFFYKSKAEGRYTIMDNSLHELGKAYDSSRLMYWINELQPNEFIVPDVWENRTKSVVNARQWANIELPENVTKVAVVQGKSYEDAVISYKTYKDLGYKKIAFSYGASYYNEIYPHINADLGKAMGRLWVISSLYKNKIIAKNDRVHLLGTAMPFEFKFYNDYPFIESIDTSNPIMAALEGTKYTDGQHPKPKLNMNEVQTWPLEKIDVDLVYYNVILFRDINNLNYGPNTPDSKPSI
jgi:hypothetical protein